MRKAMDPPSLKWKTQYVRCNLCGNDHASELWVKDGFRYVQCQICGLVYVDPQLLPSEIKRIYEIGYQSKSESKPQPVDYISYESVLHWATQYRQSERFLDVGCFKGYLLMAARNHGWSVFGTEISARAVEHAEQELGLDVFLGSLSEAGYPEQYFDVVVMRDVIEHLSDPLGYLQEIYRVLRPGGGIYIETPNFDSVTRYVFGKDWSIFFPWHQYYFTAQTLRLILREANLTVQGVWSIGVSPVSRYNAFRSLQQKQEIASSPRRGIKSFVRYELPFLRRLYFFLKSIGNAPFRLFSAWGVHVGTKLIVRAERPR